MIDDYEIAVPLLAAEPIARAVVLQGVTFLCRPSEAEGVVVFSFDERWLDWFEKIAAKYT